MSDADEARAVAPTEHATGDRLGPQRPVLGARYELLAFLGAGGMGNVYKARDLELDETIALKVIRPEIASAPSTVELFRREVKLARRVTHANVARVFDIGEHDGTKILTMELVDGESLSALLHTEGALSIARAIEIGCAVCAGVGAAHAAGVIHRDLKPDNVLLSREGRILVTDFGIARALGADVSRTLGGFVGTPAYMAPEQVEGTAVDERADVYAFGAMLYEMLTGALPWQGESPIAVAAARLINPPPDPRSVRSDLGARLSELVMRCLARRPGDRFAKMSEIASQLATITPTENVHRASAPPPAVRDQLRDKRVAVLPFRNLGSPDQAYLADALTDDLIDALSVARGLRVSSRGVVMKYKNADTDPRQLGRDLGAELVVEGSVRKTPGAFRISARLVSVVDGLQLWAQRFDGGETDALELNDRVAHAVATALTADLSIVGARPADSEAVDLYLRARSAYHVNYFGDLTDAASLFSRALERAPDDPRVLAGYVMARARTINDEKLADSLRKQAERAVQLAPSLAEGHTALASALFYGMNELDAITAAKRALRLAPNHVEAHDLLGRLLSDGPAVRFHLERAIALEPQIVLAPMVLMRHYALAGELDRAEALLDAAPQALAPARARYLLWRRDAVRARQMLESAPMVPGYAGDAMRTFLEIAAGRDVDRTRFFVTPPSLSWRMRGIYLQFRAEGAAALDDARLALDALAEADALRLCDLSWIDRCALLDRIRGEREFQAVRDRVAERVAAIERRYAEPD